MKPMIFSDIDGVITANKKLYYTRPKTQDGTITITGPNIPWEPSPSMPYPDPFTYPPGTICKIDPYPYEHFDAAQNQEDWENTNKITLTNEVRYCQEIEEEDLFVAKQFSDKDSYILSRIKKLDNCNIALISCDDRVNREWATRQSVYFIHCPKNTDKYELIVRHMKKLGYSLIKYFYIGDAMPDFTAICHSTKSFVPQDVSQLLYKKLEKAEVPYNMVPVDGGNGVLDWVYTLLVETGEIKDEL